MRRRIFAIQFSLLFVLASITFSLAAGMADLTEPLDLAADLLRRTSTDLKRNGFVDDYKSLSQDDKAKAQQQMKALSDELRDLHEDKEIFIFKLRNYARLAERPSSTSEERTRSWKALLDDRSSFYRRIDTLTAFLESNRLLKVTVSERERNALDETLSSKKKLLDRMTDMTPPATPEEIRVLKEFIRAYTSFLQEIRKLREAVSDVQRKLLAS